MGLFNFIFNLFKSDSSTDKKDAPAIIHDSHKEPLTINNIDKEKEPISNEKKDSVFSYDQSLDKQTFESFFANPKWLVTLPITGEEIDITPITFGRSFNGELGCYFSQDDPYKREVTDKQIQKMHSLGFDNIPDGLTCKDASCIIERLLKEDTPPDVFLIKLAKSCDVVFSAFSGHNRLLHNILYWHFSDIDLRSKFALYIYSVYQNIRNQKICDINQSEYNDKFYVFADSMMEDQTAVNSINNRYADEFIHPKKGTAIYKLAILFLSKNIASNPQDLWDISWKDYDFGSDFAQRRIKSACSSVLTPIKISKEDSCGYFQDKSGKYETFLNYCSCPDFDKSKKPCKHIYRLSMELGILKYTFDSDVNAVPVANQEKVSLSETVDKLEMLSIDEQHMLKDITSHLSSTNQHYKFCAERDSIEFVRALSSSGFILIHKENPQILFGLKQEIFDFLNANGISVNKNLKKSDLITLCQQELYQQSVEHFGQKIDFDITVCKQYSCHSIYEYLHRKFDKCVINLGNGEFQRVPILQSGYLSDDKITEQLILRGYYKR